jgi:hypothetical protein
MRRNLIWNLTPYPSPLRQAQKPHPIPLSGGDGTSLLTRPSVFNLTPPKVHRTPKESPLDNPSLLRHAQKPHPIPLSGGEGTSLLTRPSVFNLTPPKVHRTPMESPLDNPSLLRHAQDWLERELTYQIGSMFLILHFSFCILPFNLQHLLRNISPVVKYLFQLGFYK